MVLLHDFLFLTYCCIPFSSLYVNSIYVVLCVTAILLFVVLHKHVLPYFSLKRSGENAEILHFFNT